MFHTCIRIQWCEEPDVERSRAMSDRWVPTRATGPLDSHHRPRRLPCPEWVSFTCFCIQDMIQPNRAGAGGQVGGSGASMEKQA